MSAADKAIWYLETHLEDAVTLDEVAKVAGVSRFHLTRAFAYAVGCTPMTYLRRRRLSEAARALARGADDILALALQYNYNSHEAFTRAFRDHFGFPPSELRAGRTLATLPLVAAYRRNDAMMNEIAPTRFETTKARHFIGLAVQYAETGSPDIPGQWIKFTPHIGTIAGQKGDTTFGLCMEGDNGNAMNYVAAVETPTPARDLPQGLSAFTLPGQTYAVFRHREHVASITQSWNAIYSGWLMQSDYQLAEAASFERYDERFDPTTGAGGFELWLPVRAKGS